MVTCIVGINWGDEGKGRVADLLSRDMDIVCRCQGTSEARHTVVNERGSFMLNQLPSGILYGGVCCIMGDGMYIQPDRLNEEITRLRDAGVDISPENLKISRRAALVLPGLTATQMRLLLETRDRLCMGDLTDVEMLAEHLNALADAFRRYGGKPNMSAWSACCRRYTALFGDYIADTGAYLYDAEHAGKRILLESQSGALRDKDFGVFPYGSPTNCLAAYTPIGAGMPGGTYAGNQGGSNIREAFLVNIANAWIDRQNILDPIELYIKMNGMPECELRFRNTVLVTLDTGSGTKKTLS